MNERVSENGLYPIICHSICFTLFNHDRRDEHVCVCVCACVRVCVCVCV